MNGKTAFMCSVIILIMIAFCIGLLSGLTIIKVEDRLDKNHLDNLLIIYGK
jgi:hypothetical protein